VVFHHTETGQNPVNCPVRERGIRVKKVGMKIMGKDGRRRVNDGRDNL